MDNLLSRLPLGVTLFASGVAWAALAAAWCAGAEPGRPAPAYGYDDTPLLPGSPWRVHDRKRPQPPMVAPAEQPGGAPADAIVLFDGTDLSQWEGGTGQGIEDGSINILKAGQIQTRQQFGDCQLHVEWATPAEADGDAMNWGNSGVYLMGQFEVQIIESHASRIYADGIAAALYGQSPPLVNASRRPGQWQTFDIVFTAPRFAEGKLVRPAYLTVFHNGVLAQYHQEVLGATTHKLLPAYPPNRTQGPIMLQKHGSAVKYRNIWVRPLKLDER